MRHYAKILLVVAAALSGFGAGQAPPERLIEFSQADRDTLDKISAYLNSIRSLQSEFVQLGPSGQMDQGTFYLLKPGRLRFEYAPPSPLLVVADGRTVAVFNSKLGTVDRYPLSATPLDLLLGDKLNLRKNDAILRVQRKDGTIVIEARTAKTRSKANIAITFAESPLELRQWTVIDDQGLATTVALRKLEAGAAVNEALFVLREKKAPVGTKPRD